jgi:hypothetical protein
LLKRIDPAALAADPTTAPAAAGGRSATPENLKKLQEELQRKFQEKAKKSAEDKGKGSTPAPAGSP